MGTVVITAVIVLISVCLGYALGVARRGTEED